MKLLKNAFSFTLLALVFSSQSFAFSADEAIKIQPKTTSKIPFEGYNISEDTGLEFVNGSGVYLSGPITLAKVRSIATPLYESDSYGLYSMEGRKLHVWYKSGLVSSAALFSR